MYLPQLVISNDNHHHVKVNATRYRQCSALAGAVCLGAEIRLA
jgi:hypothetical protein